MQNLPIHEVIPQVKDTLLHHQRLVLQAPPGAGKTTALPLALLDESWLEGKKILMLEPRRLAVRTSAARMAECLGEKVGKRIGYQVKMDSVQGKKTKILIVTEGILTRKLQADPSLEDVALIIFDEYHERSLHADLSLALSLESQAVLREDLKILIMSATLNTADLSKMLDAPIVQSKGRAYSVERHYLDPATPCPSKKELPSYLHRFLLKLLNEEEGNILVFLPGVREIKAVEKLLLADMLQNIYISTLYGNLSKEAQERAIKSPPRGKRKVVLATNIAQTSLTIEGIKIVVDSGLQNLSIFNPFSGMNRLERHYISEDAATQRAGRAGRLSAGKAYHLWHRSKILLKHDTPEILQADLTQLTLELALWGNDDIHALTWLDTPSPTAMTHAKVLLRELGALDAHAKITSHGKEMSRFGLHPRLSHMMIKAKELDLGYEASLLATLLTEKDIFTSSYKNVDIRERVEVLHQVANKNPYPSQDINLKQCHYLLANAKSIEPKQKNSLDTTLLGVLLAFAYPERIAKQRDSDRSTYLLCNGKSAKLYAGDTLSQEPFLVIADLDAKANQSSIYKAISITQAQIEHYLTEQIREAEELDWNEEEQRVEVRHVTRLGRLMLKEKPIKCTDNPEVTNLLLDELEALGLEVLNWSKEARSLRDRVNFLNHYGIDFPNFSQEYLLEHLHEWLAPYIQGCNSIRGLKSLDLYNILLGQLSYPQTQTLKQLAPLKQKVASGSTITIDYSTPSQPVLAVRLQEMFGTKETPTVLGGKVKLMLHLLSPASRPMQMTQDLSSFWENTYEEVKKELRGKYKKHYWPDNPLEAKATSRTKKWM
ncbi:MAG: ATP-dependent helicase HrpB [Campylobacterota bacterium]|nr:ATP-dependent helicase HrpB [Campylobacterota bacterium]